MLVVAIVIAGLLLIAIMIRPFWGVLLLWPVLFCYPHAIMQDLLPLNIGFDDLFITFVFFTTVGRRALSGELRTGKWGMFVLMYWLLLMLSSTYGMIYTGIEGAVLLVMKDVVKKSSMIMVAFIVLNSIDNEKQIRQSIRWFMIGAIGLGLLAILQFFAPQKVAAFYQLETVSAGAALARATGTTRGAWELGGILGIATVLCFALLTIIRGVTSRPLPAICAVLSVTAVILSNSRASYLLVGVGVFAVFVFGKKPIIGLVMIAVVASVVVVFPYLTERVVERIEYTGTVGHLDPSATWRIIIWKEMLSNISVSSGLIGLGALGTYVLYGHTPHNYYLAVLVQTGMIGVFYFSVLAISLWRHTWANIRSAEKSTFMMALWKGIFSFNVGIMAYSLVNDTLNTDLIAKVLFFFWSFLYLRDYIALDEYSYELIDEPIYYQEYGLSEVYGY